MKIKSFVAIYLLAFTLISGCAQDQNKNTNQKTHQEDKDVTKDKTNEETTPTENNENQKNKDIENNENNNKQVVEPQKYGNQAFKDVSLTKAANGISVSGKASVFEGVFQYEVVENGKVLKTDRYQTAGAPAWGEFHFTIDESLLKSPDTKLNLFVYSAKDGSRTNVLTIPLNK